MNATELDTNCFETSEIIWDKSDKITKVRICKRTISNKTETEDENNVLDVFLEFGSTYSVWSCSATVVIKLFYNAEEGLNGLKKTLIEKTFDNKHPSRGFIYFVNYDQLDDFLKDEKILFEVDITTGPYRSIIPKYVQETGTKLRVIVKNLSQLNNASSPEVFVRGVTWSILPKWENNKLFVYLNADKNLLDINWPLKVRVIFKLLAINSNEATIEILEKEATFLYHSLNYSHGVELINSTDIIYSNNIYIANDSIAVLVEFTTLPTKLWN